MENSVSGVTQNSSQGEYLNSAKLIIIDEASMTPSGAITVIDRLFRDLTQHPNLKNIPFAGKVVLFSGDFRQTLPVVPHAGRNVILDNCLKNNPLWPEITKLRLEKNMRLKEGEEEFARFLLQVGNGSLPKTQDDMPILPKKLLGVGSPIDFVYGNVVESIQNEDIKGKGILAPKNSDCDLINNEVLSKLPGDPKTYESIDTVLSDDTNAELQYPTEFLNSVEVSGLPKHKLILKSGAVVLLMRNLNTEKGLINGTKLQVTRMFMNSIQCKVITGASQGDYILIPRIKMCPSETTLPFRIQRNQFPLSLSFCMTINKAQGQSLNKVAIYLPRPVFTHGQLYVALSRSTSFAGIKMYLKESPSQGKLSNGDFSTTNVVFQEILND